MTSRVVVTGAAGFIGASLAKTLTEQGHYVIGSDRMSSDDRWKNIHTAGIQDFLSPEDLLTGLAEKQLGKIDAVFHQGACSATTERDEAYMLKTNFDYSKALLSTTVELGVPTVYASSASVYGLTRECSESPENESPLNVYAYSKLLVDRWVRANLAHRATASLVGLRYFNVYGELEGHKGRMASVVHHFYRQATETGVVRLFEGSGEFENGGQLRDFVYVGDVVDVNMHFAFRGKACGIANVGTGVARSFNDVASAVLSHTGGKIEYIPFPADLNGKYQNYTRANLGGLTDLGYKNASFVTVEDGVSAVVKFLTNGGRVARVDV
jgi:ADP-L-glycero-D-manno-heptose 6-epimerase